MKAFADYTINGSKVELCFGKGRKLSVKRRKFWFSQNIYQSLQPLERNQLKTLWEKEKMLVTSFSPFSLMFSTFPKPNFNFSFTSILSSVNAFNLDKCEILTSDRELTHSLLMTDRRSFCGQYRSRSKL